MWGEAVGIEGVRVVADGDVEIPLRIEAQRATDVAALVALRRDIQNLLLGIEVELLVLQGVAGDTDDAGLAALLILHGLWQGMVQVNPAVFREVRVKGDAEHSVFKTVEDLDGGDRDGGLRGRLPHLDHTGALGPEDAAIGRDGQLHGILHRVLPFAILLAVAIQNDFAEGAVHLSPAGDGSGRFWFCGGLLCFLRAQGKGNQHHRHAGGDSGAKQERT